MFLIGLILFFCVRNTASVTVSMKDFMSNAFKSSARVKLSSLTSAAVQCLSIPPIIPTLFYGIPPLLEGGPTDWVKDCFNRYPLYEESLKSYSRMRRKKYYYHYCPSTSRESTWYKDYVLNASGHSFAVDSRRGSKFRRRFRLPFGSFNDLMVQIREEKWFPNNDKCDCRGVLGVPLELLVLGSLRYLGRGWTFDDLEEATGISEESHRVFFHRFIKCGRNILFPKWVKAPSTEEEINDSISEFAMAGFPGCIGSTDASHIRCK